MDRQYLESFSEDQLKHYLNTLKQMKNLTIALGQENLELAEEYKAIVERKKEAHFAVEKKKNGWTNWIHKSKDKITNLLHLNKEEPSEFQPQFSKDQRRQVEEVPSESPQKKRKQREVEEPSEKKDINMNNFNFDDLYYISRDKFVDLMGKGGEQIKHIKQLLIEKVIAKESKVEKDQTAQNEDEKREGQQQHNYTQLTKEEDLTIKNTPPKIEEGQSFHQSDKTADREYTPADL